MYISQFFASNYRSLKEVTVRFANGKNVIVGKNNCGKSNIIKGIEILVGEKFPTFQPIGDNDFYTYESVDEDTGEVSEVPAENLFLEVTLEGRDLDRDLILSIKKQSAFSRIRGPGDFYQKDPGTGAIMVNYDLFQSLDDLENRLEVEVIDTFSGGRQKKTQWMPAAQLYAFIQSARRLKVFFCKSRVDEEKMGFGLIVQCADGHFWLSHFLSKKLRDSLLTTTVISATRSHKTELRLVHYTWFGKLVAGIWNKNKSQVEEASGKTYEELIRHSAEEIKSRVDIVFASNIQLVKTLLEGAIAHKAISFKFLDNAKDELYKNVQLFVNDGIDRPIHEKGTGIQSAVIIALFSLYCNEYHNNSSLLIAEEPELFLHPQARRVISAELNKFLNGSETQERQLIISTHSTEYLKHVDLFNITRVFKDAAGNFTIAKQLDRDTSGLVTMELKRFLWSNNSEIFFADKVILVEGGEVFLIPAIVDKVSGIRQKLDYDNISVARVNGKGAFLIYARMLDCFQIDYLIVGDLDCFKDEVRKLADHLKLTTVVEDIGRIKTAIGQMEVDYQRIDDRIKNVEKNFDAQVLKQLFEQVLDGTADPASTELCDIVSYMQTRYTKGDREKVIIDTMGEEAFVRLQQTLRDNKVFIWSKGELEQYYQPGARQLIGSKDIKALQLSYILNEDEQLIEQHMTHIEEIKELVGHILKK
ncbi:ATP-dependent nuclease [Mucilaginibacter lappiensis]|uniref:ATP-dependent nuclease n=1 Tax=Mucilaginibacter lappiensis TaxID=354630 RepID=UPI003D1E6CD4